MSDQEGEYGWKLMNICHGRHFSGVRSGASVDDNDCGGEDEEGEEEQEGHYGTANDRIIFLIDARKEMFALNETGQSQIANALYVALAVYKAKIVASEKSSLGISFFNTAKTDAHPNGIRTLFPIGTLSAALIRSLQSVLSSLQSSTPQLLDPDTGDPITSGLSSETTLKSALWHNAQSFNTKGMSKNKINDFKRVWIFTNCDDPKSDSNPKE
jgi:hypothetical protein